jgi:hypothetical protein
MHVAHSTIGDMGWTDPSLDHAPFTRHAGGRCRYGFCCNMAAALQRTGISRVRERAIRFSKLALPRPASLIQPEGEMQEEVAVASTPVYHLGHAICSCPCPSGGSGSGGTWLI